MLQLPVLFVITGGKKNYSTKKYISLICGLTERAFHIVHYSQHIFFHVKKKIKICLWFPSLSNQFKMHLIFRFICNPLSSTDYAILFTNLTKPVWRKTFVGNNLWSQTHTAELTHFIKPHVAELLYLFSSLIIITWRQTSGASRCQLWFFTAPLSASLSGLLLRCVIPTDPPSTDNSLGINLCNSWSDGSVLWTDSLQRIGGEAGESHCLAATQ